MRSLSLACAITAVAAPAAKADIVGAVDVPSADGTNLDIALVNAATGARMALPAGINTAADEYHPSITPDGKRLVFQRVDRAAGTNRIVVLDFPTGGAVDVFDSFAAQQEQPGTPFITTDGSTVITGGAPSVDQTAGLLHPALFSTSLATFPLGPFSHAEETFDAVNLLVGSRTDSPDSHGGRVAAGIHSGGDAEGRLIVKQGPFHFLISEPNTDLEHPALDPTQSIMAYESLPLGTGLLPRLGYRSTNVLEVSTATTHFFPALVNAPNVSETRPTFSSEGRYLGFVRRSLDAHDRLFVFDTQTQTLLNTSGIDLGFMNSLPGKEAFLEGNLSLREVPLLRSTTFSTSFTLNTSLASSTGVGILVQRIVGQHKLLGKTVPTLRLVGHVPLGQHSRGHFSVRWNRRVNGHELAPGSYLVTVRAVTSGGVVRDFGRSFTIRVGA